MGAFRGLAQERRLAWLLKRAVDLETDIRGERNHTEDPNTTAVLRGQRKGRKDKERNRVCILKKAHGGETQRKTEKETDGVMEKRERDRKIGGERERD